MMEFLVLYETGLSNKKVIHNGYSTHWKQTRSLDKKQHDLLYIILYTRIQLSLLSYVGKCSDSCSEWWP